MGILKHLLFWPVTGPSFLTRFSLEKVSQTVREELTNDEAVKEDLMALQMRLELGEIDDDEYVAQEAALMARLRDVRFWREEFGIGTSGGPVRVARSEVAPPEPEAEDLGEPSRAEETEDETPRGGIASPEGARVEIDLDWS